MNDRDNVATAVADLFPDEKVVVKNGQEMTIVVRAEIPFGHKFAIKPIGKGNGVVKYGEIIGRATENILKGDHVHVHNIESLRGRGDIEGSGAGR